jgi:hypothetical protein
MAMESNMIDPYLGYSSCPDTARVFTSQSAQNQVRWVELSEQTIREFIAHLSQWNNFRDAYFFLAQRRQQIAILLKHKEEEGLTPYYGQFRQEGDHARQTLTDGNGEQYWIWQHNKAFALLNRMIEPIQFESATYEDEFITGLKETVMADEIEATYYTIEVKTCYKPFMQLATTLSTIELFDYHGMACNTIRIEYTPIEKNTQENYYQIANHFYQKLLRWTPAEGLAYFLQNAGELAFLLAHLLLVKRGNTAITEWMLRALAFHHGIELGRFNYAEGISWDLKAILTPSREKYIEWFNDKAFLACSFIKLDDPHQEFSFKK